MIADPLGEFQRYGEASQWMGRAAFVAALVVTGILERLQFRLRFLEAKTWWASNSRDIFNALAFTLLWSSAVLLGFSGPLCLVVAGTIVVLVNMLQSAVGNRPHSTLVSVVVTALLGAPVALAPAQVDGLLKGMLRALFEIV